MVHAKSLDCTNSKNIENLADYITNQVFVCCQISMVYLYKVKGLRPLIQTRIIVASLPLRMESIQRPYLSKSIRIHIIFNSSDTWKFNFVTRKIVTFRIQTYGLESFGVKTTMRRDVMLRVHNKPRGGTLHYQVTSAFEHINLEVRRSEFNDNIIQRLLF